MFQATDPGAKDSLACSSQASGSRGVLARVDDVDERVATKGAYLDAIDDWSDSVFTPGVVIVGAVLLLDLGTDILAPLPCEQGVVKLLGSIGIVRLDEQADAMGHLGQNALDGLSTNV